MNQITINEKNIVSNGGDIHIGNGKITIGGKEVKFDDAPEIKIEITGNVHLLNVDNCSKLTITGDCGAVKTHNASVDIGGNVSGDVETHNGNIDCENVGGNVSTKNGNIKHRK